mgnify:CR=1 FL=1
MEREKKVLDASIIVKWFSEESNSDKAIKLKDKHISGDIEIIVPELIFLEVLNSLRYKTEKSSELEKINKILWDLQFIIVYLNKDILENATKIAIKEELTLYDSIYISIAKIMGVELITADEKLSKVEGVRSLERLD